ncbi:hypothetical protein TKK_0016390 [Trichogramma kaykai]
MIVVACYRSPTGNNTISLNDIGFVTDAEKAFQELGAPIETSFEALDLQRYKFNINEGNEFLTDPINYEELMLVLSSINAKSAPGVDKISYDIICSLPEFLLRTLLDIYNDCLHTGIFPQTWSEYLITFIPKSSNNCKSRPIALASCLLKVLEKIINNRLLYYVENQNLLSESQFGFRKSRSCIDNLSIFVNYTQKAFFEGQRVVAVFLDIKGAYNNVVPELLVKDLAQLNIPLEYLKFFQQLLCERTLIPTNLANPEVTQIETNKGLPQGSCLSPILWSIYTSFIKKSLSDAVEILEFADDLVIFVKTQDVHKCLGVIETVINDLKTGLKIKNLTLAPEKCELMIFSQKNFNNSTLSLKINDTVLKPKNRVKFLGMHLDKQLTWNYHINKTKENCLKALNIIKCLRGVYWGASPSTLLMIHKSMIRAKIEYGGFLISPCQDDKLYELQKIQNAALRTALGCMNSTPINVLHVEAKIPLLETRLDYLCYRYILKNMTIRNNPVLKNIEELKDTAENPIYQHNYKKSRIITCFENSWYYEGQIFQSNKYHRFETPFKTLFYKARCNTSYGRKLQNQKDPNEQFCAKFPPSDKTTNIYTDGSRILRDDEAVLRVGCAVWSENAFFQTDKRLPDRSSIFAAESSAVLLALEKIDEWHGSNDREQMSYRIFSDSLSNLTALNSIHGLNYESPLIEKIKNKIIELSRKGIEVDLLWIPAHVGLTGNEQADTNAKEATNANLITNIDLPVTDLFYEFKQVCYKNNNTCLIKSGETNGSAYFQTFFKESHKTWFNDLNIHRKVISTINRIRSGHNCTKSHLHKIKIKNDTLCKCEREEETVEHIFWQCHLHDEQRVKMLKKLRKLQPYGPYSIIALISQIKQNVIDIISEFIINSELNI